ncbi:MAG: ATP-dependent Clp protease proteolytic subunit [Planctomycetes bacterium]|nr:ATP-dependent Clp protease proteolytic subunit [Planctomycetota bacterium]
MLDYDLTGRPMADDDEGCDTEKGGDARDPMLQKLLDSRTIVVSKPVTDDLARGIIGQLFVLEQIDCDKPITVIVNSPGGSADSGFAIHDALKFVKCPVRTITMGICASAAVMIHLAAQKDQRFVTPNSRFLLHQPSMRTMGQASDIAIVSAEIDRMKTQYNQIVSDTTGRTLAEVDAAVHRDFWLTAQAGVEWGLASKIVNHRAEIE